MIHRFPWTPPAEPTHLVLSNRYMCDCGKDWWCDGGEVGDANICPGCGKTCKPVYSEYEED